MAKLTSLIEAGVEKISFEKASKCMLLIYQPKVPKALLKKAEK